MIVVEGGEKVGKSYSAFELSRSPKVGRTLVFDMGEGSGDAYAELGPYELVEHDGTFGDFLAQLKAAAALPMVEGRPNVIVIDSVTVLWEMLKDWGGQRARKGRKARETLHRDPDAEIKVPMNIWTDIADRWGQVVHTLRYSPVISILIARGREVAKVDKDGSPIAGETEYKLDAHKATVFQAGAHVRCIAPTRTRLMSVWSLHVQVPPAGIDLPDVMPLEHLIFDVIGAGSEFATSTAIAPVQSRTVGSAKQQLIGILERGQVPEPTAAAAKIWKATRGLPQRRTAELTDAQWEQLGDQAAAAILDAAGGGS
jgi:hypothetical protein